MLTGSLSELHYCTLEPRIGDAFLHFYSNQTVDFPSHVTFKDVKRYGLAWSWDAK